MGHVVTMALFKQLFTRTQHWSHTRCVCECQLFFCSLLCASAVQCISCISCISCLDSREWGLYFLLRKMNFYSSYDIDYFLCDIIWCDNLPRDWGRLLQVTSLYKLFIDNHSVTFERNSILFNFNCSQGFTRNFGTSQRS